MYYFDGSQPKRGRSWIIEVNDRMVGHISYSIFESPPGTAELDLWIRYQAECAHVYGADALQLLRESLASDLEIRKFVTRPSARNNRAVRPYQKAGFMTSPWTSAEQEQIYGAVEFRDAITLECSY